MSLIPKTFNASPTAFQAQGLRGLPLNKELDHLGSKASSDGGLLLFSCRVHVVTTGREDAGPGSAQPHPGNKCPEPEAPAGARFLG